MFCSKNRELVNFYISISSIVTEIQGDIENVFFYLYSALELYQIVVDI